MRSLRLKRGQNRAFGLGGCISPFPRTVEPMKPKVPLSREQVKNTQAGLSLSRRPLE